MQSTRHSIINVVTNDPVADGNAVLACQNDGTRFRGQWNRRQFVGLAAAGCVIGLSGGGEAAVPGVRATTGPNGRFAEAQTPDRGTQRGGHLYMQTNESRNAVIHYRRSRDGTIVEAERTATGGAGSGVFKPISGQSSAPNAFEGAGSVILTTDQQFLFTTNGGDNTVSSFRVHEDGRLTLLDVKPTGNAVTGKSGTAKSLAYASASRTLFVLHAFGPDHIRALSVDDGKLTPRDERYSVNTKTKTDRVSTQAVLSPDQKFLLVDVLFDARPAANPDGTPKLVVANAPDADGLVVFPVRESGALGPPAFHDAGGAGPFYIAFLHGRSDAFVNGTAVGDGLVMSSIDRDGNIRFDGLVPIDTRAGKPSELCWLAVSPDNRLVFATNFGYGTISSYRIADGELTIEKDPASAPVPGDGTFRAVNGLVSSGPSDSWLTPDGAYLYQIYGNASKLIGYSVNRDGSLTETTQASIPYNSPQGLAGF
jgi:6-phosphogluconolactonase (cycloisomerase 2 family)